LQRPSENVLQSLILNGWAAQLAVIGANGLPNPGQAGNVLLPFVEARLSIRIPPTKNPEEAEKFIIKTLTENPPYNAKITITNARNGGGFNAPVYPAVLENAINESSQAYFGKVPLAIAEGGSIPFLNFLGELWPAAQFIVTGVLGPLSNAHGPNEFLHIPYVKSLICSMSHILANTTGKI
jgi:acetylornithine deacetylase/succinyl-diaminopimelate desuccinylase-like protein